MSCEGCSVIVQTSRSWLPKFIASSHTTSNTMTRGELHGTYKWSWRSFGLAFIMPSHNHGHHQGSCEALWCCHAYMLSWPPKIGYTAFNTMGDTTLCSSQVYKCPWYQTGTIYWKSNRTFAFYDQLVWGCFGYISGKIYIGFQSFFHPLSNKKHKHLNILSNIFLSRKSPIEEHLRFKITVQDQRF